MLVWLFPYFHVQLAADSNSFSCSPGHVRKRNVTWPANGVTANGQRKADERKANE